MILRFECVDRLRHLSDIPDEDCAQMGRARVLYSVVDEKIGVVFTGTRGECERFIPIRAAKIRRGPNHWNEARHQGPSPNGKAAALLAWARRRAGG